jgi:hypothetical protein
MDVPRDMGVRLDHLFERRLKEDFATCGACCFEVDYGLYPRM